MANLEKTDKELEEFRNLMEVPTTFEDGFRGSSLLGAIFVALIMVPGSLYMELLAGFGVGPAAQWVTVILFIEVAKRANAKLSRAQLFILFYMAGAIMGQHVFGTPLFQQFLVRSDAAIAAGISTLFPDWVAPKGEEAYANRTFFQLAWLPAIGLIAFRTFFTKIDNAVLGYGLFRQVSDVERLPFPMAPVGAQGLMALADDLEKRHDETSKWRWRVFAIGGAIGMVFGLLYMGIPTLTQAIFGRTMQIFPIPFVDLTQNTQDILPAVATGITFDLGQLILGMVMPFFAVLGSFIGAILMLILNPLLYSYTSILYSWQPGMKTVETLFRNNVDLYFSTTIGLSLAVAVVGLSSIFRSFSLAKKPEEKSPPPSPLATKEGRGDIPNRWIVLCYLFTSGCYILLSGWLIGWHRNVMLVLIFYAYFYTPLISYVTARLEGLAGQMIEIPFIREISFILSGYQGIDIWFIPIPKANYGVRTVFYRQAELTGTKFTSTWLTDLVLFPIILISMIGFSSFIWSLDEVPSSVYPYTMEIWEFEAKNMCLIFTSTLGEYSEFAEALKLWKVGIGFGVGILLYGLLSFLQAPTMLFYGLVRGLSGLMIHVVLTQFLGALLGEYYFRRKIGEMWKKYIVVLSAGFFCGGGLLSMFCIGIRFLMGATSPLPY